MNTLTNNQSSPFGLKKLFILILAVVFISSCTKDDNPFEPTYFISSEAVKTITKAEVIQLLGTDNSFPTEVKSLITYDLNVVKITYHTVGVNGEPVIASGAIVIPQTTQALPVISFQHGTIRNPQEAPSIFTADYLQKTTIFASVGYIMVIPDYLGYGASASIPHPYEHRASLATATRDMLRAAYEYFKVENLTEPKKELFLTGYSEGGFATMATLKLLQEKHADEFTITAATLGAGAYNKTAFGSYVITSTVKQDYINYFLWVLDAYSKTYCKPARPYSYYYNEPWATNIQNEGVFTSSIEQNPSLLFKNSFVQALKAGSDTQILAALADNDCYDWKPNFPLIMFHGNADTFVPYFNSQTAYQAMTNRGATAVQLVTVDNGTHETALPAYLSGSFRFFVLNTK